MAGKKHHNIDIFEANAKQGGLFNSDSATKLEKWYPKVYRDLEGFNKVLFSAKGLLGLDFEFPPTYKATIVGISTETECAAIAATPEIVSGIVYVCRDLGIKMVGHSVIGAEREVIRATCGLDTSIDEYEDSMLTHYLCNADLAKAPDKGEDDSGALGFMGLGTCMSMALTVPVHKDCRGTDCEQIICPKHDVRGYCAVDSWGGLASFLEHRKAMEQWNVPVKLYRELMLLTDIAQQMQYNGIKVNMAFVKEIEAKADAYKEKLCENLGFNPRAPQQVRKWFAENGIVLESNDKVSIKKALTKCAAKYGFDTKDKEGNFTLESLELADSLPKELEALYDVYEYKGAGKGLDPWFGPRYVGAGDLIHPRFITTGASTSRWSSSRPNFTNVPARGFGSLVRGAIVPRSDDFDLIHADAKNLELRVVMYLGGVDPNEFLKGIDPFNWLVSVSGGAYDEIAREKKDTPRGIAKTVSHASSYLEGIKVIKPWELGTRSIKEQIDAGALYVYRDWEYCGGVVAFTGSNLAERLFGDKSYKNRKRALQITEEVYFKKMYMIRDWHRKVLRFIEDNHYVQYPTGHFVRLYSTPEENAKVGTAALGQGCGAHHMQGLMLRYYRELQATPLLFVHDAFDFEVPRRWTPAQAKEFISLMGEETDRFPGFKCPYDAARGQNGLEYKEKDPNTHIPGAMVHI